MTRYRGLRGILPALLLFMSVPAAGAFNDPVSHPVGEFPSGVTIGDVNGDGLADVAVASASVSLLFSNGSSLEPAQQIDHGAGDTRYVAIEDIDGDGDRDLVVLVQFGDAALIVFRNDGNGSFASPEANGATSFGFALRMADIDLDGDPDAVLVDAVPQVTVLRNDGNGSFEVAGSYPLEPALPVVYVAALDVADLNGDGYPDVVGCSDNSGAVEVLLNDGQGGLLPSAPVNLGQQFPTGVLTRDVNGDGRPDLLVVNCTVGPDELRVGLNDAAGGFLLADVVPLPGACQSITNPTGLTPGYFDDDTLIDLIYPDGSSDSVHVLRGLGDGTFEASEILPTDTGPFVVAAGDVNGDGSHDVISGNQVLLSSDTIVVMTNQECAPLLDQTVKADASGVDFFWPTSLPYLAARGVFVTADDVGGFVVDRQFAGDANFLHDADSPLAGSGFWYLVRPDCIGASWTSAGSAELPGRDLVLP